MLDGVRGEVNLPSIPKPSGVEVDHGWAQGFTWLNERPVKYPLISGDNQPCEMASSRKSIQQPQRCPGVMSTSRVSGSTITPRQASSDAFPFWVLGAPTSQLWRTNDGVGRLQPRMGCSRASLTSLPFRNRKHSKPTSRISFRAVLLVRFDSRNRNFSGLRSKTLRSTS